MHPALSIVFFTTASGAGFALLCLLGLGVPLDLLPQRPWFGFASGFLLLGLIVRVWSLRPIAVPILTLLAVGVAWWSKEAYWRYIDTISAPSTVESATALGRRGRVRLLEPPHTEANYLLQEM